MARNRDGYMHIVNWKEGATRGFKPTFDINDQADVMFRMLGIKKDNDERDLGWRGKIVQTKKLNPNGDVKNAFYAELEASTHDMGQKIGNKYWSGSICVTVGFAPKVGDKVPVTLKDKEAGDYPVVVKTWSAFKMTQDDMFVLSLGVKEATSILVQLHQDEKNVPKVKIEEDELTGESALL